MHDIFNINPKIGTSLCAIIGLILTDDLTANEQNLLGEWLILIGQILVTNATSQILIQGKLNSNQININSKQTKKEYNPIIYDIETLKNILNIEDKETVITIIDKINNKISYLEKIIKDLK